MDSDALRSVRNAFYLGNLKECCQEAQTLINKPINDQQAAATATSSSTATPQEVHHAATVYKARAEAQLNPQAFITSVAKNSPLALQAILQLTQYQLASTNTAAATQRESSLATFDEWTQSDDATLRNDVTIQLCAATAYLAERRYKDALRTLQQQLSPTGEVQQSTQFGLESLSLQTCIYLQLARPDLAQRSVRAMQDLDDDDTLTQLTLGWLHLAKSEHAEASGVMQELQEKFGSVE